MHRQTSLNVLEIQGQITVLFIGPWEHQGHGCGSLRRFLGLGLPYRLESHCLQVSFPSTIHRVFFLLHVHLAEVQYAFSPVLNQVQMLHLEQRVTHW